MKLAPGVTIAGRYRLERRLAVGGMGSLWVARHAQLDVEVAIKFIDPKQAGSAVARQRFEREAKAAATLRNAHVVHVQDYGVDGDLPYLVMELLHGEDLGRRLDREKRLSLQAAAKILHQTARGLRKAHEAGVVHRDLKPANIFLARTDEDEEVVKILDFGIAKETGAVLVGEGTKTGELMGSPHYMSPEQVRGSKDLDHRSDLWSLGVILFRAVTGRLPFASQVLGAVIAHILADPIPRASEVAPDLPSALDGFFLRAFSRDKTQRFQSAREMSEAFTAIVQGTTASPLPRLDSLHDASASAPSWTPPPMTQLAQVVVPAHAAVPLMARPTPRTLPMPPTPPVPPTAPRPPAPPTAPQATPASTPQPVAAASGPTSAPAPSSAGGPAPFAAPASSAAALRAAPVAQAIPQAPRSAGSAPMAPAMPSIDVTFDPVAEPSKTPLSPGSGADSVPTTGGLAATGGHVAPDPPWARRSPSAASWGVGISVLLGVVFVVLFLVMKGGGATSSEPGSAEIESAASSTTPAAPSDRAPVTPPPVTSPAVEAPAGTAAASASASAQPARVEAPKVTTPAPKPADSGKKKKPSWGF
ncbi:MAG: protein kinase [Byssovorax sp.]